jgi:hypothetical protein
VGKDASMYCPVDGTEWREGITPGAPDDPSDAYISLSAVNNASYQCALSAQACLGALLMARAWDRMTPRR